MTHPWLAAVRAHLAAAGDPERAAGQQAYMKSAMPYHGCTSPEVRALLRPTCAGTHRRTVPPGSATTPREVESPLIRVESPGTRLDVATRRV